MKKEKKIFKHRHGEVEGIYINAGNSTPLVIIVNGHNGFYNYGMFPFIQQRFFENGISSYSFNFSHGGINGDGDHFTDLEKYEQNCMRLEVEDLAAVLHNHEIEFSRHERIFLFSHSLGSIPAIFGAKKAADEKISLNGIILAAPVSTLDFWPPAMLAEWATAGVYYKKNNRTKQDLPLGFEFLQEILKCERDWNAIKTIAMLTLPVLIIHGAEDEAVSPEHGRSLYDAVSFNPRNRLEIIPGATHTFNTRHPFDGSSAQLDELIRLSVLFIMKN
jgi:pimeloyl-ACP methyl ester carboxylesterase